MKIAGIIAEYDPFHKGHAYQIAQARALGAQTVVVCMSCDVVQRGGFASLPPAVRAQAALQNGADLVVALPNPWACATAETFAAAGVHILASLGCDTLAFGAETPDAQGFMALAELLDSPALAHNLQSELGGGQSFAAARARAARKIDPHTAALLEQPNDLLGVEYCKAILRQKRSLQPLPIARVGAVHGADAQPGQQFASASAVRRLWSKEETGQSLQWLPQNTHALYKAALNAGQGIAPLRADIAVLSRLRAMTAAEIADIRGVNEGLENRLAACVRTAVSLPALYDALKTKRYAHSRLRRLVLDAALGYTDSLPEMPPFALVLGAKGQALPLLKHADIPAGSSLAKLAEQSEACRLAANAHAAAADLAALCRKTPGPMGLSFTQKPVLLK